MYGVDVNGKVNCYKCEKELEYVRAEKVLRHDECPACKASVHCCKMCHFYDPQVYNECKEPLAERILEKEKANFCSYFVLVGKKEFSQKEDLFAAAAALFKK